MIAGILPGIEIAEQNGADAAIARASTGVTAFVGRTLKGPVNWPVVVTDFTAFERVFGGLWQPAPLSYAVEQFFDNGGKTAVIVRVTNGARPPTLVLGGGAAQLRLQALAPGTREHLRAAIDHDGIGDHEPDRFNLVVQRVRGPGSELVEDQEIFRRVSVRADSRHYLPLALGESRLVRLIGPLPVERPPVTPPAHPADLVGYVAVGNDGDDGAPLTDYDIIGSAQANTGLFALRRGPPFNMLCIPPLSREQDVGLSTWLVAGRLCRDCHALLLVDPPREWQSAAAAVDGMRGWPFRADLAVMYFPRLLANDRLRGRIDTFAPSGAVAGLLARAAATAMPWSPLEHGEVPLRPGLRPECAVTDAERARLAQFGVNVFGAARLTHAGPDTARTLAAGNAGATDWRYLGPRRLAFFLAQSIGRGTRWMLFERNGPALWRRAAAQVEAFLAELDAEGAFPASAPGEGYFVICDERLNDPRRAGTHLLFGYAGSRAGETHSFLVSHRGGDTTVRAVAANRYTTCARRVEEEIESSLLRGLAAR